MDLETEGYKTYFRHCPANQKNERLTIGGIYVEGTLKIGVSRCSKKDQFEKRKGREVSIGRATECPILVLNTTTPKKTFCEASKPIEKAFNDLENREEFLSFIKQNPQEEKVPRKERKSVFSEIKQFFTKEEAVTF